MSFAHVATRLVKQNVAASPNQQTKLNQLDELNAAGLSRIEILSELKELAESCTDDEKHIRLHALKIAMQMHGMLIPEEQARQAPIIQLTVIGDNTRVSAMLCPQVEVTVNNGTD